MIDISNEHLIPIREVPRKLPPRPTGRRVHISAVYRWLTRGIRGVCLESVRIGGSTYTSMEALQRFADQLNGGHSSSSTSPSTTVSQRKRTDQAARQAEAIIGNKGKQRPSK